MSGGPIFNDQGLLCGLICSGAETETDYYSHVTTLWPSMATVVSRTAKLSHAGVVDENVDPAVAGAHPLWTSDSLPFCQGSLL
jgi:hypothetical protein